MRGTVAVDLVLVVVVYVALTSGPVTGLLAGTLGGLLQDALSSGVIGIGGLAKTVVGFLAGIIGTQFIVAQPLPRFVVFFARDAPARGDRSSGCTCCSICGSSARRTRPWPDRRSATRWSASWRSSWSSCSRARWSGGGRPDIGCGDEADGPETVLLWRCLKIAAGPASGCRCSST